MNLIVALVIASLVYIVQKRLYAKWWNRNLDVTISFEDTCVREGDASALTEVIYNGKFLPLPVFHVKFSTDRSFRFADTENTVVTDSYYRNDVFSVLGYRKITRRLPFQTGKRGLYGIPSLNMTARDFFMTTNFAYSRKSDAWLYVLPKRVASPELSMFCSHLLGELETRRNQMEDPYTFRGIREYTYGDTYGKINWKATAKASKLMVNMYGYTSEQRVRILLNLETNIMVKTEYLQEMSIRMAGTIAEYFLQHKVSAELVSNGIDCMTGACERVEAGMSMEHGETIDKYLARIKENAGIDAFMQMADTEIQQMEEPITYVIISPYYKEDLLLKLDYMHKNHPELHMVVPYYDIQDKTGWRGYMQGVEVKWNEI